GGGPRRRRLLEGDAPAGEDRGRARPRALDSAARRALQRHGPASAPAHDGPPPDDGRGGPDDPLLVAHPRGGRADRGRRPRPRRGAARPPPGGSRETPPSSL